MQTPPLLARDLPRKLAKGLDNLHAGLVCREGKGAAERNAAWQFQGGWDAAASAAPPTITDGGVGGPQQDSPTQA